MAYNQFKGEGRVIILKGSYPGAKLGKFERSLRDSYGLAGLMKGTHTCPQGVGHTHLRDGCLAILLSGRGDQMNKPYFKVFLYMGQLKTDSWLRDSYA